ncbi:MAG: hypothetical protein IIX98_01205, partial [Clostridia bacterium]|nr:hypothetical protein [Clostridia bacterium]
SCGYRMSLYGDREVVFMTLFNYIVDVAGVDGNVEKILSFVKDFLGIDIDLSFVTEIFNTVKGFIQERRPLESLDINFEGLFDDDN